MEEGKPKKSEHFIEPGSKEDREATKALNEAFDVISKQSKERHRLEKEAAETERERRIGEGLPLGDECYFTRLNDGMHVRFKDLNELWRTNRVAIHLPEHEAGSGSWRGSLDPHHYPLHERGLFSAITRLGERGGYVWLEDRSGTRAKVGVVRPGTNVEDFEAKWSDMYYPKYKEKVGASTTLGTLPLTKVREVGHDEATLLRVSRPVVPDHALRNLLPWKPTCGALRLISMFGEARVATPKEVWNRLSPELKLTVCVDFLRHHDNPGYPRLKHLLLTATTTGKDVDVYGVAEDGTEIMAQVPFRRDSNMEGFEAGKKFERLRKYGEAGRRLVCFVPRLGDDDGHHLKLFDGPAPAKREGVQLVSVEEVLRWIEKQPAYADRLFSA